MKQVLYLLLLLSGLYGFLPAHAQPVPAGVLEGRLTDSAEQLPVSFATVVLSSDKGQEVGLSDSLGVFRFHNLSAGSYTLRCSFTGYRELVRSGITVTDSTPIQLGTLVMQTDARTLRGVTVTARKALVQDKGDRLVYNAENDITNTGGTALEVLEKAPMVSVDPSGSIQMRGSDNLKVLLNGKPSGMMARNLSQVLKSIPASNIKAIEIITSPSAKYDAEGAAGVINIITKKPLQGLSGNLELTGGWLRQSTSGSLHMNKGKFGLSFNGNFSRDRNYGWNENLRTLSSGAALFQSNDYDNTGLNGYAELSATYDADTNNLLSLSVSSWYDRAPNKTLLYNRSTSEMGSITEEYRQNIDFVTPSANVTTDLAYTRKMKRPNQELTVLGEYSYTFDNYFYTSDRYDMGSMVMDREKSRNKSKGTEYTLQLDYAHPLNASGTYLLEAGAKTIIRSVNSNYTSDVSLPGDPDHLIPDPSRSNLFDYRQYVYSGYSSLKLNLPKDWLLVVGGRLEQTRLDGDFRSTGTSFSIHFNNVVPSLILSRKIGQAHTVKMTYTQRIRRPQVWDLNPFVNASDPKNLRTGNPELRPEISYIGELAYSYAGEKGFNCNISAFGRQTDRVFQWLTTVDAASGVGLTRPDNIAVFRIGGLTVNSTVNISKAWTASINGETFYASVNSDQLHMKNGGWNWWGNLNTSYRFPKDFTAQLFIRYNSGWIWLQGRRSAWYSYVFAVRKEFWEKKAGLTLGVANPFTRYFHQDRIEQTRDFRSVNDSYYRIRDIRLSLNLQFGGQGDKRREARKVHNDDGGRN